MLPSIRPSSKLIKKSPDFNLKEIFENNRKINLAEQKKGNIKKLKAVVHIRQGDTAVVETPWNTFIRVWLRMVNTRHQEYLDISDIKDNKIIAVHEFYQFYTKLRKSILNKDPEINIHSDGFALAFHILEKDAEKLNFSSSQLSLLKNWRTDYNKKQFENFEKLPETSYYIGEEKGLLFKLLMGFFASDLIIVGSQQRMLLKLYDIYEPYKSESVVILLYKNFLPIHKQMRNKQIKKNIIFVNLYNYNIEDVLTQIQNHMRIKNHFIKPE